jgi:glycosyltransferase involved in cell wall biosynthesis
VSPRRVLQIAPFYPPALGGVENVTRTIAELLARTWDVDVVTTDCGARGASRSELRPSQRGKLSIRRHRAVELAHTPLSPGLAWQLLTLPRSALAHVHVAHAFTAEMVWLTSAVRGRRYVVHFHLDVDASGPLGRFLPRYKRTVLGRVLRAADAVIALSAEQAAFLTAEYRVRPDRIAVIPNGVAPEYFVTRDEDSQLPARPLRLLFVGRLSGQKNVPRLLDALALVQAPVEVVLVGDGDQRDQVIEHLATTGLTNVRLVGPQRGDDLLAWYRWADAFVLPSDKEGMPLVLLEAMAAGLPIVATDVLGTRALVEGVGVLAAPNPKALAAAITEIAGDPVLRQRLAEQSRARARSLSWETRIGAIEQLYAAVGGWPLPDRAVSADQVAR